MIILQWWIAGLIVMSITTIAHLIRAEMKGYEALKWHAENDPFTESKPKIIFSLVLGLTIWPVRFCEAICDLFPKWYSKYERK